MAKPTFEFFEAGSFCLVNFEIPGGITTPTEFSEAVKAVEGKLAGSRPILLNGRGPVWGYGMLIHAAHPTPAVGCYDPRLGGYVIVATHDGRYPLGYVVPEQEA